MTLSDFQGRASIATFRTSVQQTRLRGFNYHSTLRSHCAVPELLILSFFLSM